MNIFASLFLLAWQAIVQLRERRKYGPAGVRQRQIIVYSRRR